MNERYKQKIIKAFYTTYNKPGYGFLEKMYERVLIIELRKLGLSVQAQVPVKVYYESEEVGNYFADVMVENCVMVELKTGDALIEEHEAQRINY